MRALVWTDLLKATAHFAQRLYDELSTQDEAVLVSYLNARLRTIWNATHWPDLMFVEKRYFRQVWSAGTHAAGTELYDRNAERYVIALKSSSNEPSDSSETIHADWAELKTSYSFNDYNASTDYAVGDQVYYYLDDKNYQMHTNAGAGTAPTNASYWGEVKNFDKVINYEQSWETNKLGHVYDVYDRHPKYNKYATSLNYDLSSTGIQLLQGPNVVYVRFRKRVPIIEHSAHSTSSVAYKVGNVVRFAATGDPAELYECTTDHTSSGSNEPTDSSAPWTKIEIPFHFRDFLAHGAASDLLQADEKEQLAGIEEQRAQSAIMNELRILETEQQQSTSMPVEVHTNFRQTGH
tara:strand:- start:424 stop:1473 length:1050 start_codon:yes stop_codon:yes gene_type:complete